MTFPNHWVTFYFRTLKRQVGHPQLMTDRYFYKDWAMWGCGSPHLVLTITLPIMCGHGSPQYSGEGPTCAPSTPTLNPYAEPLGAAIGHSPQNYINKSMKEVVGGGLSLPLESPLAPHTAFPTTRALLGRHILWATALSAAWPLSVIMAASSGLYFSALSSWYHWACDL